MNNLEFPNAMAQRLVDGLMGGYKDYIAERKQKQQELKVSSAFAWTRGNFIDSQISKALDVDPTIEDRHDKAGYAWEYIQFIQEQNNERALIIVKNARQLKRNFNGISAPVDEKNYLYQLAGINNPLLTAGQLTGQPTDRVVQLELALPEITSTLNQLADQQQSEFSRFYIVTYEVDTVSKMITRIDLTMPNQAKMNLTQIQNLTPFIETSQLTITSEELDPIKSEQIPDAAYEQNTLFGYEISTGTKKAKEAGAE